MTADTIETRVARGAALLDEKRPGWHNRIHLEILDLRDCEDCVIGQEFYGHESDEPWDTSYDVGARELLGDAHLAAGYGFDGDEGVLRDEFPDLTAEWRRVIEARRESASSTPRGER